MRMKQFLLRHIGFIIGAAVGSSAVLAYSLLIGCGAGGCVITSNPAVSAVYGALVGVLFAGALRRDKPNKRDGQDPSR